MYCPARPSRLPAARRTMVAAVLAAARTSAYGSLTCSSSAVAARPRRPMTADAMSAASPAEKNEPGTLCATARVKSPAAASMASSAAIDPAPADSPKTVTRDGSPPNAAMFSRTHRSAAT